MRQQLIWLSYDCCRISDPLRVAAIHVFKDEKSYTVTIHELQALLYPHNNELLSLLYKIM